MKRILCIVAALTFLISCSRQGPGSASAGGAERVAENANAPRELPAAPANLNGPIISYAPVVDRVAPAVVTIRTSQRVHVQEQFPFFNDPFFRQFFGGRIPGGGNQTEVEQALGSGVVVRPAGYILTNNHVVGGAQQIRVTLSDRQSYTAKLVGADAPSDLAVLKINASNLPVLELGNSDDVRVGDVVLAVGNPLGIGQTVTNGIISAKGRETGLSNGSFQDFLQTDAPINKGNSGGALVNTRAELVGINSEIISTTGASIGIGFAIPSNMARNVMDQLISKGKVARGMLGVTVQTVTSGIAEGLGMKQARGVLISNVTPGGPAANAGLKRGDVILDLNGKEVNDPNVLRNEVASTAPGTQVTLTVLRNGQEQKMQVKLGELTPQTAQAEQQQGGGAGEPGGKLGITVTPLTPDIAAQVGVPRDTKGVVIEQVDPNGLAAQAGLQAGDVIQEVNRQPVRNAADVRNALGKSGNRPALLLINRGGQTLYVSVGQQ